MAVVTAGLILSSCSMSRDASNTANLNSQKLQAKQELANQTTDKNNIASVDITAQKTADAIVTNSTESKNTATIHPIAIQQKRSLAHNSFIKNAGHGLAQTITLPKIANHVNNLLKVQSNVASVNHKAHPTDANYLILWIVCLIASILFYVLAAVFTYSLAFGLALIFSLLGVLASIAALVFFIMWLIQLFNK